MRWMSFTFGAVISLALFAAFSSPAVARVRPSVDASINTMYAVLPSGALVDVAAAD